MGEKKRKVGIIGAGVSGLLACKYVLSKGHDAIVFESQCSVGGVWTKTIRTTKLQTVKSFYQFSDFPWPSSVTDDFPDAHQVLDYIQSYAHHFSLIQHIKFNSKVRSIDYEGSPDDESSSWTVCSDECKWKIVVEDVATLSVEAYQVDFVILCVGRFSDVPNIPEFPPNRGPDVFHGKVIHSMDYVAMDNEKASSFVRGKKVIVVGFQKSALDIAMECSTANGIENPCTMMYRNPHWNLPDYLPWGVPLAFLYLNRFAELCVHKPGEGHFLSLLATALSPVRWAVSKFVESDIKHKHPLEKFGMVPEHSFLQEINSCLTSTVPRGFYDEVKKGSIILKKSSSFSFCEDGVLIAGEERPLETDLVILATGFKGDQKLKDIFASRKFQEYIMGSPDRVVPLYRQCVHPRIPRLAVIGFSESLTNLYTSEMICRWLVELLDGTFKLPSVRVMEEDISRWDQFMKRYAHESYRRSCIGALHIWYNDQLCKDMGWNPRRKNGLLSEWFEPYGPMDYAHRRRSDRGWHFKWHERKD
ncbi:hypothetical protein Nepgr_004751 [Nepenthes gracilis]|uniref:Flavin-containing monooxygenase n=1 Tax=Nepenthes gracilis TaxID=150966 RepID=A0AAD3S264_NEPGR|nr:hypothetical protein Nepgr_004751 [Nepenthes gracilis]